MANRENKFRAWDTQHNKMWSPEEMGRDELTINPDGRGFVNVSGTDARLSEYMTHLIPLQWTGLRDKNGVEIYEGDILRIQSQYETDVPVDSRAEVIFSDGSFRCTFHDMILNSKVCSGSEGNWNCERIGNIYEHLELLK